MTRIVFVLLLCLVIFSLMVQPATAQTKPAAAAPEPAYEVLKLSETLFELRVDIGYVVKVLASIGPDGVLLVDTGLQENGKDLLATLRKLGGGEPKIVILSHSHEEHWAGNRVLGPGPLYIGHENMRKRLQSGPFLFLELPEGILPRLTVKDEMSVFFNGEEIRIRSFAGAHDNSDLVVWFTKSKAAFVGALVTALKLPTVDGTTGDIRRYPEITRHVLDFLPEDVKLIPGHGEDATHAQGLQFLEMLEKTAALVKAEIAKGRDLDTLTKEDLLKDWQSWEVSYSNRAYWLRALYEGYSGATAARNALTPIHDQLYAAYKAKGSDGAVRKYLELKAQHPKEYRFDVRTLYGIADALQGQGKDRDSIPFFELAIKEFPESPFARAIHDSVSQAYVAVGDKPSALQHLKKVLELDPKNEDAAKRIKELEGR